ncbi:phosphoribosylformylglycinamidine synthase subunit PurL [Candidatus Magnetominusculus xianensis]|uniref:Phosphoribosylformylglycinamidine synthase subunit PurL n=1 Tax=Candidatus Magnetominusculus xianensis TaxID=1748249 RepID=A0ABR5SDR3_9BACT|nr:phosphoribosylformylglycinamidine synthase subunit PurL [Candidatus Magnetominusculus xianensis]KWT81206.1 phosphoribosylformylglycinamidine synthase [Candidatus Magnetominusculus xianensis]MBF0404280.1 phosphoribosylformylglycinamidine synthase subunit PurL [Nitrospirota bacterium]
MKEPLITEELIKEHGLTPDEYGRIVSILGRTPMFTELGIFSVMWSEHCSYKSSRLHLKKLPVDAPWVIQGPGENAGVIDIGDGLAAVFKMESHNHPSYIEPYEGAATGVGGILRDIFTMGARPVASLNSLRFGPLSDPYHKHLFGGVVSGIAGYGNCIGVPTVGGEIYCHPCYAGNILVNVFNVGIVKKDKIFYGKASGDGNLIIYAGSKTGKDGIHGVTMASEEFTDDAQQKKPNVQIGDPFTEKLLLEACLEAMDKGLIVGIQDMGGAGLTSSSSEMAGRAETGVELELSLVPLRAEGMIPYEIMLSESQERMLLVVERENKDALIDIFKKWDLDAVVIGKVGGDGFLRVNWHGKMAAEIPATKISTDAPIYDRPSKRPTNQDELNTLDLSKVPDITNSGNDALKKLLASPSIASKELVWQQYDHMVRTDTIVRPGSDAAVVRVKGTKKALAMSVDCNSRYCWLDPYLGAVHAVCEAARNVACSGALPLAVTDNLNFGNPEKPEVMWQFIGAIEGIKDACIALNTPVISGNVSLYNETKGDAIFPTPTIAIVGVLEDADRALTQWFKAAGDVVMLIGQTKEELGGSEYLSLCHGIERGLPPTIDPLKEKALHSVLIKLNAQGLLKSAHDCSEGGLAVTAAESAFGFLIGAEIDLGASSLRADALLFGESATRVLISATAENADIVEAAVVAAGLPIARIGKTGGDILRIKAKDMTLIEMPVSELKSIYDTSLERGLNQNEHI